MIMIIICIVFCILSEFLTYKFIKRIDKKERKKLQIWEDEFVKSMKPKLQELEVELKKIDSEKKEKLETKEENKK